MEHENVIPAIKPAVETLEGLGWKLASSTKTEARFDKDPATVFVTDHGDGRYEVTAGSATMDPEDVVSVVLSTNSTEGLVEELIQIARFVSGDTDRSEQTGVSDGVLSQPDGLLTLIDESLVQGATDATIIKAMAKDVRDVRERAVAKAVDDLAKIVCSRVPGLAEKRATRIAREALFGGRA